MLKIFNKIILDNYQKKLIIITFIGAVLRILGIININFSGDFKIHWEEAERIVRLGIYPLLGPNISANINLFLGPFYYYFLSIIYFIGNGNYKLGIIFFSIINSLSIPFLYIICRNWFTKKTSLKITALFAFSYFIIISHNYPWNPHILIFLNLFAIYCLEKIKKEKQIYITLLLLTLGILMQLQATSIFLFPVYLFNIEYKKIKPKYLLLGILLFIFSLLPWLIANYKCNNCQIEELKEVILLSKTEPCNFIQLNNDSEHSYQCSNYIRNPIFFAKFFSKSLFGTEKNFGLILSSILIFWFLFKGSKKNKKYFLIWLIIPNLFFLLYSPEIYFHYFLIFIPLPFIFLVLFLEDYEKKYHSKFLTTVIYYLILTLNVVFYLLSLKNIRI